MPNGARWPVHLVEITSGCHFYVGWLEFRCKNHIYHGDKLIFTLVDVGIFHVKRYKTGTSYPPQGDLKMLAEDEEYKERNSLDVVG
ncbi:B3 domain-containing protein REM20-like [Salvia divinorum]|uniref:B3 domain-containing protein REM20-like n=1 Tax=Salvia divinorum TaxID=28513 RepID=A0ABD1IF70_SALDI